MATASANMIPPMFLIGVDRSDPHGGRAFDDVALALYFALCQVGEAAHGQRIVLGGARPRVLPPRAILFNLEQVAGRDDAFIERNFGAHKDRVVWDYAQANVERLRAFGLRRVVHCPIGFVEGMGVRLAPRTEEPYDVLHYGAMSDRRYSVIRALIGARLNVRLLNGVYGEERDLDVLRSKIVLNCHYYDEAVFEMVRVSHLAASMTCVVSESGGLDPELEAFAAAATVYVPVGQIVETCVRLVGDSQARTAAAIRGRRAICAIDFVQSVRGALNA